MTDIAPIKGLIELQDDFTSRLGLAEFALQKFSKENQESLKAVAGVAAIVTGAFAATAAAVIELGKQGSVANDLDHAIVHFSGSARAAADDMAALRAGTKGTVDNFTLAKEAAHLLSTGVKLAADDFGVLGQAAFILNHRGLGETKDQLALVSDALVTGRTRALANSLGVIENTHAEEDFAAKLGTTAENLSDVGKAEAHRIEVMRLLRAAVKDTKEEERNFGEEFEAAKAAIANWVGDLGKAIDKSAVFKAGLKGIEDAFATAFGSDKGTSIKTIVGLIENVTISLVGAAQVSVQFVKVVESSWYATKTAVLGATTDIVANLFVITSSTAAFAKAFHLPGAFVSSIKEASTELLGMTIDLAKQTAEAGKAVTTHSAFDDTLDRLSGVLGDVKAKMLAAKDAQVATTSETEKQTDAVKDATTAQDGLNSRFLDTTKMQKALQKSTQELSSIWADYYAQVAKDSGTSAMAQQADVEATFQKNINSLDKLDPLYKQKYAAYEAIAKESLKAISMEWDSVKDQSKEALEAQRDAAEQTYHAMLNSSLTFSREVLDAQRQKWFDLRDAVRDYGTVAKTALGEVVDEMHELIKASDAAYEAQKKLKSGFSYDVTSQNFQETAQRFGIDASQAYDLAKKGYSFAEIIQIENNYKNGYTGPLPPPQGPRIPGFAEGGVVMVGEQGPEAVRLPFGSQVYPTGMPPSGNSSAINFHPGSIVVQYPIMNSPRAINEFGNALSDLMLARMRQKGYRVG